MPMSFYNRRLNLITNKDNNMNTKELILPDDWEVKEVVGNKVIIKEKDKELPKTWGECNKGTAMSYYPSINWYVPNEHEVAIKALCKLLICRNAWWKQLGWKPDLAVKKFCISTNCDEVYKLERVQENRILAFPTSEVRDQFLESFRDLIEEAKELL